jgi:hypothetical protein
MKRTLRENAGALPALIGGPARAGQCIADGRGDVGRLAALFLLSCDHW